MADALSRNAVTSFVVAISSYKIELEDKMEGIKVDTKYPSLKEKKRLNVV